MPHVLIVEDDEAVRRTTARFLTLAGYTIVEAENGEVAMQYLIDGGPASVILLDLRMPVMDGWTFRRDQRRLPAIAAIPVIVLSGAGRRSLLRIGCCRDISEAGENGGIVRLHPTTL